MSDSSLPTLFGNNNMKMDVACKVLIAILKNSSIFHQQYYLVMQVEAFDGWSSFLSFLWAGYLCKNATCHL